jgi:hypothetical protein
MVLLMFARKLLATPLISLVGGGDTTGPIAKEGFAVILVSFAALPLETLTEQAGPI